MEELISKKELLQKYSISYGALYRWKRMGLIPEDWFLRRTAPTGQETFFYRKQICPRVELILSRKDVSLEELAKELREPREGGSRLKLLVTDRFSTRSFFLEELTAVTVTDGSKTTDFLNILKGETP